MIKLFNKFSLLSFVLGVVVAFFFFADLSLVAQALSSNYFKTLTAPNNQLTISDWNYLPNDFVHRTGGPNSTMQGALDMGNNRITNLAAPTAGNDAATRQYVDDSMPIVDASGNRYRMYCATSPAGGWSTYGNHSVSTVINTSSAGFSEVWRYLVGLSGSNAGPTMGQNSIYNLSASSFELRIVYAGWHGHFPGITGADANSWGWQVHWCGIGR